jgi:hypothetical protein
MELDCMETGELMEVMGCINTEDSNYVVEDRVHVIHHVVEDGVHVIYHVVEDGVHIVHYTTVGIPCGSAGTVVKGRARKGVVM